MDEQKLTKRDQFVYDNVKQKFPYDFIEKEIKYFKVITSDDMFVIDMNDIGTIYNYRTRSYRYVGSTKNMTNEILEKYFGILLKIQMEAHFVGQEELARKTNTTQQMISRYINGDATPSYIMLKSIADAIGCKVDDLYLPIPYSREKHRLL